jgi:hypothetical protein
MTQRILSGEEHLQAFLEAFLGCIPTQGSRLVTKHKRGNPLLGLDDLSQHLDKRFCVRLPNGSKQQDEAFVRQAVAPYKLTTCYVLSAYAPFHEQTMHLEEALEKIVGDGPVTIISFLPGKVAYFEGHSPGERYLCIR